MDITANIIVRCAHSPPPIKITIKPDEEKHDLAISWPNIIRIDSILYPVLSVDWDKRQPLKLDTSETVEIVEICAHG